MKRFAVRTMVLVFVAVVAGGGVLAQADMGAQIPRSPGAGGAWSAHMQANNRWQGAGGGPHSGPHGGWTMGGSGAMGGGMMGGSGATGGGMMGGAGPLPAGAAPVSAAAIEAQLQGVLTAYPAGAMIADVMTFANNVYAQVVNDAGDGLAEVIVGRFTGVVMPEPGPNMMWNTSGWAAGGMGYGGGRGMLGDDRSGTMMGAAGAPSAAPRYDLSQAQDLARGFLAQYAPAVTVLESQSFPGYYTFDYGQGGIQGMLSVNAYTGAVWPHTWHGAYLGSQP